MVYKWLYKTPSNFVGVLMNSDGEYLTGLWFIGSRDASKHIIQCEEKELLIFKKISKGIDTYFTPKHKMKNLRLFREKVRDIMHLILLVHEQKDMLRFLVSKKGTIL